MIAFSCTQCGKQFNLKPEFAGRKTACSGCKAPMLVPTANATADGAMNVPRRKGESPAGPEAPGVQRARGAAGGSPSQGRAIVGAVVSNPPARPKIAFSCECGMKFSVPTEFAGRKTTCPTCKATLTVPAEHALDYRPTAGQIKGTQSSLAQAGMEGGVTLAGDFVTAEALSMHNLIDGKANDGARYVIESELARGGMGAVMRAVDCDIRREVAVKYLLDQNDAKKKSRFVEEAQITGQLEHPNIVPIHELGVDADKRMFFSMKMVRGRSLAEIVKGLRDEPAAMEKEYPLGKLLGVFVNVCNALAYAHARGVVHRDLKPANIMVGDFGEVYVMDWGLAKVLGRAGVVAAETPALAVPVAAMAEPFNFAATPLATPLASAETSGTGSASGSALGSGSASGKVVTNRELDADLTQEGAVIGTPVYMPPEQASGRIQDVDERSDVYSMGAILYEILTLAPPISKDGGYWAILMRVNQGQIEPPQVRAPERAKAGKVPPELAAIAMKALARNKANRYPRVASLREDVERYLDGRSVSAKQDKPWEVAWKLAKRNRGFSAGLGVAVLVLFACLVFLVRSWLETSRAYARLRDEQEQRSRDAKKSAPAFLRAARLALRERAFDDALTQAQAAVEHDPDDADARLLRGQLLLVQQKYADALPDLRTAAERNPKDAALKELVGYCLEAKDGDPSNAFVIAEHFSVQRQYELADGMMRALGKNAIEARDALLFQFRRRIDAAWSGAGNQLVWRNGEGFHFTIHGDRVTDLEPLRGMPLVHLNLDDCKRLRDLGPLKDMPLASLSLTNCSAVVDLQPISKAKLTNLNIRMSGVRSLEAVRDMPLTSLNANSCRIDDLGPLEKMRLTTLDIGGTAVRDLAPLKGMPLATLYVGYGPINDLAPLKGMPLAHVRIAQCSIADLSVLRDAPIKELHLQRCPMKKLDSLRGLPLEVLVFDSLPFEDLTPLRGMKIKRLNLQACGKVRDIAALEGMPLEYLNLTGTSVRDLKLLEKMPLDELSLSGLKVSDLSPLKRTPLRLLNVQNCAELTDLSSLAGVNLEGITLTPKYIAAGMDTLKKMDRLSKITVAGNAHTPAEFWKRFEAGEFK